MLRAGGCQQAQGTLLGLHPGDSSAWGCFLISSWGL